MKIATVYSPLEQSRYFCVYLPPGRRMACSIMGIAQGTDCALDAEAAKPRRVLEIPGHFGPGAQRAICPLEKSIMKFNEQQLARVSELQQKHNLTRKSAVARIQRELKAEASRDGKSAAANDDTNKQAVAVQAKVPKAEPVKLSKEQVNGARAEGVRLFKLSGRPTRDQFQAVYGPLGHKWTWVQRAKQLGLATAEEAASTFQACLIKVAPHLIKKGESKPAPAPAPAKTTPVVVPSIINKPAMAKPESGKAAVSANPTQRKTNRRAHANT